MPKAIINLDESSDRILQIVKGKYGVKNKSDAINLVIEKFEEQILNATVRVQKECRFLHEKEDLWMIGEEIPDCTFFFSSVWLDCFVRSFDKHAKAYKKILCVHRGYNLTFYFGEKDSFDVGEHIVEKFLAEPEFTVTVNKEIIEEADKLRAFAEAVPETGLANVSDTELNRFFQEHKRIHSEYYEWAWIPVAVDMFHNNLTNTLKEYLREKGLSEEKVNETFITLTQPSNKSLIQQEQEEFLQIAQEIEQDAKQKEVFSKLYKMFQEKEASPFGLATHTKEYETALERRISDIKSQINKPVYKRIKRLYQSNFYVKFLWIGKDGVHSFDHYVKELVKFIGRKSDATAMLQEMKLEQEDLRKKKEKVLKQLQLEKKWKAIFENFGEFMVTKIYRRYAQIYAIYRMQPILKEIARRLNLTLMEVNFMMPEEVEEGLLQQNVHRKELAKRTELCVYYADKDQSELFVGMEAKNIVHTLEKKESLDVTELKGQTGCMGKVQGTVKIVIRPEDMAKMNEGDILVSIATDPDIIPAMKKAAAFVTEQGGVTSHAAIVAREMQKPCVIGTKIATRVLKDGDQVEVDANKGIVRKI